MQGGDPCPCGSGASLAACCLPFIEGRVEAPTAEALMRSRYTAFCTGAVDYLLSTHRGAAQEPRARDGLRRTIAETDWLALTVLGTRKGGRDDAAGTVDFVAAFRPKAGALQGAAPIQQMPVQQMPVQQMHERSRFVREDDRWLYVDGEARPAYKAARNDSCWCGSGRKAKHCHS